MQRVLLLSHYYLSTLATNAARKLRVLGHGGNALGMSGAQVGVFKHSNKACFGSLLKGKDGSALETKISCILPITSCVLSDLTSQALERSLANQQVRRLLAFPNLSQLQVQETRQRIVFVSCIDKVTMSEPRALSAT